MWTSLREKLQQEASVSQQDPFHHNVPFIQSAAPTTQKATLAKPKRKNKKKKRDPELVVNTIRPRNLKLTPVEEDQPPDVPKLAHDLDRVLFNPGVYDLQDPRSRVFNFDPHLASIMPVKDFDFNALKQYVTSSKDMKLRDLCAKHGKKYCGSTSSMTAMLSHFHFLLSAWRKPNFNTLTRSFSVEFESFTKITRAPAAAFAHFKDGVYAIDADKKFDTANILSMLGKSMEKLLTLPKEEFEKYSRTRSHQLSEEEKNAEEGFHYTTLGDFLMRSQLDAHDPRLPGTGMFDLKTRAVVSIRMDVSDYEKGVGYEIRNRTGQWQSYEREYYDMIRSAFLKYSLQVRMGRMDGIFVAFHNTERIFGFQYISLSEMDYALHGTWDFDVGDHEFKASLSLLNDLLDRAAKRFPGRSLRLHVETRETNPPLTYFFAEPVDDVDIARIQEHGKKSVEKFETEILGLVRKEYEAQSAQLDRDMAEVDQDQQDQAAQQDDSQDLQGQSAWDELMSKVDETVENDALGLQTVKDAIHEALEQSGLLRGKSDTQKESYLDALVEALTAELSEGKDTNEASIEEQQTHNDEQQGTNLLDVDGGPDEGLKASGELPFDREVTHQIDEAVLPSTESPDDVTHGAESSEVTVGTTTNDIEDSDARTADLADEEAQSNNDMVSDSSLKDLIMKVARGVNHKSSNMGTFEQVLSELAVESNQPDADRSEGEDILDSDQTQPTEGSRQTEQPDAEINSNTTEIPDEDYTERELLGMYVTVQNKIRGETVDRVCSDPHTKYKNDWTVEYNITELPEERARRIHQQIKRRRMDTFKQDPETRSRLWHNLWGGGLERKVMASKKFRESVNLHDAGNPVKVAWDKKPIQADVKPESERSSNPE
ncbi:hypothetical protein G7Z17_g11502 [Cylindrodendrum hubeiense]|uniref:Pet127-domain-containing protein n=1 Tax=Cylindrodendrum hubeiense TaxID=595255 RepID=A0A9P5GXD2_9HYPO|nr:hypothetical protein G7Z17_g11502 [Cylindrodendrum hubeiense]